MCPPTQSHSYTDVIFAAESNVYSKGFKHYNIRSLWPRLESVKLWLDDLDFDEFTFSETWLNDSIPSSLIDIENYDQFRQDRPAGNRGGGLITLIRQSKNIIYDTKKHIDRCISSRNAEIQVLEFKAGYHKKWSYSIAVAPRLGKSKYL